MSETPRPWRVVDKLDDGDGCITILGPDGERICDIFPYSIGHRGISRGRADAALIVAAVNDYASVIIPQGTRAR